MFKINRKDTTNSKEDKLETREIILVFSLIVATAIVCGVLLGIFIVYSGGN